MSLFPSGEAGSFPRAAAAGGGAASTVIWSVDFSGEADHDFRDEVAYALSGVDFTLENAAGCTEFQILSGVLAVDTNSNTDYYGGTYSLPHMAADFADLAALGAGAAYDPAKTYVWRAIMTAASPTPSGNEGMAMGLRTVRGTSGKDAFFGGYAATFRCIKGSTIFTDRTFASVSQTTPRSYAVRYGGGTFTDYASESDESSNAFGGTVILAGYQHVATTVGIVPVATPDILDLSAATAEAYVGIRGKVGGSRFLFQRLELHEVG